MPKYTDDVVKKFINEYLAQNPSSVDAGTYYTDPKVKKQVEEYLASNPSSVDPGIYYSDDKVKKIFSQLGGSGTGIVTKN